MSLFQITKNETLKTLILLWAAHLLVDMMIGFWSVYKTLAHLDIAIMGIIAGVCPFFGEGMQMIFGTLGDKGYRKLILAFGIGAAAFSVLIPYTTSYPILFFLYLMTCMGSGAFHPNAIAMTTGLSEKRKGLFVAFFASGGALGLAISHLVFSTLYLYAGAQTVYLIIPYVFLVFYVLWSKMPSNLPIPANPKRRYGMSDVLKLFKSRDLTNLYFFQLCNQSIVWGLIFLLPDILLAKGYDAWLAFGGGHLCLIIGGACMMIPGGYLSDKYSAKTVLMASNIFGIVLLYLFLFLSHLPPVGILCLLFAIGASLNIAMPISVALGNKIMPSRPGLVSAFLMGLVLCVAEGIGPGGGGLLVKLFIEDGPTAAMAILGTLLIGAGGFITFLPREVEKTFEIEYANN